MDGVPPNVVCPDDIRREINLGQGSVSVSWSDATATDNSGRVSLVSRSHSPGSQFNTGITTVTYTFEDPSGNQGLCSFNVLVIEGRLVRNNGLLGLRNKSERLTLQMS